MRPTIYLLTRKEDNLIKVGKTGRGNVQRRLEEYSELHDLDGFFIRRTWNLPTLALMDYAEIEAHRALDKYQYSHNGVARELFRIDVEKAEEIVGAAVYQVLAQMTGGVEDNIRPRVGSYAELKARQRVGSSNLFGDVLAGILFLLILSSFLFSGILMLLSGSITGIIVGAIFASGSVWFGFICIGDFFTRNRKRFRIKKSKERMR